MQRRTKTAIIRACTATCNVTRKYTRTCSMYTRGALLTPYDNKNVVYIAYVGKYDAKYTFKYGKSTDVFQREMGSHRKNFERFDMLYIHTTNFKDQVECLLKKELLLRDLHTSLVINEKHQKELFQLKRKSDIKYVNDIVCGIIQHVEYQHGHVGVKDKEYLLLEIELEKLRLQRALIEKNLGTNLGTNLLEYS